MSIPTAKFLFDILVNQAHYWFDTCFDNVMGTLMTSQGYRTLHGHPDDICCEMS